MGFTTPGITSLGLPGVWFQTIEIDYNDPTWTPQVPIRPYNHVFDALVNITTAFTAGSSSTIAVGDSASASNYLATTDITVTSTGITKASGKSQTNAKGKWYSAADNVKFAFTFVAGDTAGVAYGLVMGMFFPDSSSGALVASIQ